MKDLFLTFFDTYCATIALWEDSIRDDKDINITILRREICGALTLALYLGLIDNEEFNLMLYKVMEESDSSC